MKKQFLSILLVVCMLTTMIPLAGTVTGATGNDVCYIDANENGIFDDGDVKYESVSAAVEAVGGTEYEICSGAIILLENTSDNITVSAYQGITINLNGKTLSAKDTTGAVITNNGTLTVTDTSATGDGGNITGGTKGIIHNGYSLTLEGKANVTGNTANIYLPNNKTVDILNDGDARFTGTVGFTTETAPTPGSPIAVSAQNAYDFDGTFLTDNTDLILYDCKTTRVSFGSVPYYFILKLGVPTAEVKTDGTTTKTYGSVQDAYNDKLAEEIKMIADSEENTEFNFNNIETDIPVILDLNGHILKAANNEYAVITTHKTTTIKDSNPTATHTEDLPNGGVITGGSHGIEARLDTAQVLNMYGGTIDSNTNGSNEGGAGVYLYLGTFNMYGGAICKNTSTIGKGGGVYVCDETILNMYDGTISNNLAGAGGGGVYNENGTFNMYGGTVSDNSTNRLTPFSFGSLDGAGVYNNGTMTVGGDAVIENNKNEFQNKISNLYLNGNNITLATGENALKSGANIGVSLSSTCGQFTENGAKTDEQYFFSDNVSYADKYNDSGYLELVDANYVREEKLRNGRVSRGTVEAYYEGETVKVTATPRQGYALKEFNVFKTGETSVKIPVNKDGTFTMPGYEVTLSAKFAELPEPVKNVSYKAALTLNDTLDINFKASNFGADFSSDDFKVYVDGTEIKTEYKNGEINAVLEHVASNELANKISVDVYYGDLLIKSFTYSVETYCNKVLSVGTTDEKNLVGAVMNYGYEVQQAFGLEGNTPISNTWHLDLSGLAMPGASEVAYNKTDKVTGLAANLTLGSSVLLNITVTGDSITEDDVKITNQKGERVPEDRIKVEGNVITVSNISAHKISNTYRFEILDTNVFYGINTYCGNMKGDATVGNVCYAIYYYGQMANACTY